MEYLERRIPMKKKKPTILILGSEGMLGRYVYKYLRKKYSVEAVSRELLDASDTTSSEIYNVCIVHGIKEGDTVINCIGTIKPQVDKLGTLNALLVNSVFPHKLADVCEKLKVHLIHPTTDCVYSGKDGKYDENSRHDISDVYGRTKSLGEPTNATVIRTSIIGEELKTKRSLVEWLKGCKNQGVPIPGFTNHFWNGITCLQFAKICDKIIKDDLFWVGVRHLYSNDVSKFELVSLISRIYKLDLTINPVEHEFTDRTLRTINDNSIFEIPSLDQQISEMKEFKLK